nr:nascent polypeptide-associated complex subunit alpha, muscle-specific form-like [Bubalus bubalis]
MEGEAPGERARGPEPERSEAARRALDPRPREPESAPANQRAAPARASAALAATWRQGAVSGRRAGGAADMGETLLHTFTPSYSMSLAKDTVSLQLVPKGREGPKAEPRAALAAAARRARTTETRAPPHPREEGRAPPRASGGGHFRPGHFRPGPSLRPPELGRGALVRPCPRPRRHFPEVVPALLPGLADGTALTFRRNAILGLYCWPLCRMVILAPGTQNRDARDGRGSPRRARPRSRAQAERGCPPRPRPAPPGARIRAGQSARRARLGERCAGGHLAPGGGVGPAGRGRRSNVSSTLTLGAAVLSCLLALWRRERLWFMLDLRSALASPGPGLTVAAPKPPFTRALPSSSRLARARLHSPRGPCCFRVSRPPPAARDPVLTQQRAPFGLWSLARACEPASLLRSPPPPRPLTPPPGSTPPPPYGPPALPRPPDAPRQLPHHPLPPNAPQLSPTPPTPPPNARPCHSPWVLGPQGPRFPPGSLDSRSAGKLTSRGPPGPPVLSLALQSPWASGAYTDRILGQPGPERNPHLLPSQHPGEVPMSPEVLDVPGGEATLHMPSRHGLAFDLDGLQKEMDHSDSGGWRISGAGARGRLAGKQETQPRSGPRDRRAPPARPPPRPARARRSSRARERTRVSGRGVRARPREAARARTPRGRRPAGPALPPSLSGAPGPPCPARPASQTAGSRPPPARPGRRGAPRPRAAEPEPEPRAERAEEP